jgi:hypothetical protein
MAVVPDEYQKRVLDALQYEMSYKTLSAIHQMTIKKTMIDELHNLSKSSSFDYIDVMQQYIDLAHTILSKGVTQPDSKYAGEGWSAEIAMLYHHLIAFIEKIKKLASEWRGFDYKTKYDVDFIGPLKSLTTDTRIGYMMAGYDTPSHLVPFFEDLKRRLVIMTETDTTSNQFEKATRVWMVCKILEDRAIFIAARLISTMKKILVRDRKVVSINLKEIIARNARAAPSSFVNEFDEGLKEMSNNTTDGGRRSRHKRSGHTRSGKRSGHKRSGHKRSGKRSGKR